MIDQVCRFLIPGDGLPCKFYIRPADSSEPGFCGINTTFRCVEAMKHKLPAISYSRMTDFISCPLKYYHGVIEGLQVKPQHMPEAMKLGRGWDLFIHHMYEDGFDHLPGIQALQLTPEQSAKLNALMRAFHDLEISINKDGLLGCQYKISATIGQTNLTGYVDRAYEDSIRETKLSARPEFYTERENMAYQLGTYFLSNDQWESATVEITRVPALRTGSGRNSDETPEAFENRIYGDILSRPAYYFIGWDRKFRTYGVKFYRTEFDLDEIWSTFRWVILEIKETCQRGSWYPNNLACHVPAACQYLPIKRTGVVSEEIYERRAIPLPASCQGCLLTEAMSSACEVTKPCPKWRRKEVKENAG